METICASSFKWNKGYGICNLSDLSPWKSTPTSFYLKSPKTGKRKKFSLDMEEASSNEFWDGEFQVLHSEDKQQTIKVWNY